MPVELDPVAERFILHWGEMGTKWGINRTVAQTHALLFISPDPLDAETIMTTLGVARSNVSQSLKELQGWGIVRVVHVLGSRRDHFESLKDVWELFRIIMDERKKREIDPTLEMLRQCVIDADKSRDTPTYTADRLRDMAGFLEAMTAWYDGVRTLPHAGLVRFIKMGKRIHKLVGSN